MNVSSQFGNDVNTDHFEGDAPLFGMQKTFFGKKSAVRPGKENVNPAKKNSVGSSNKFDALADD